MKAAASQILFHSILYLFLVITLISSEDQLPKGFLENSNFTNTQQVNNLHNSNSESELRGLKIITRDKLKIPLLKNAQDQNSNVLSDNFRKKYDSPPVDPNINKIYQEKVESQNEKSDENQIVSPRRMVQLPYLSEHYIQNTLAFRSISSKYDPMVFSWLSGQSQYFFEKMLKEAFKQNPSLFEYVTNPANNMIGPRSKNLRKMFPNLSESELVRVQKLFKKLSSEVPSAEKKSENDSILNENSLLSEKKTKFDNYISNNDNNSRNFCSSLTNTKYSTKIESNAMPSDLKFVNISDDEPELSQGCSFVNGDLNFRLYVVCDSNNITSVPSKLPITLDLLELNSTQVKVIPKGAFSGRRVITFRFNENKIESIEKDAFEGTNGTIYLHFRFNRYLKWVWFEDSFKSLDKLFFLTLEFNDISYEGVGEECLEKQNINEIETVMPNLIYLSFTQNPLVKIPRTLFAPLRNSSLRTLLLTRCQLEFIHPEALTFLPHLAVLDLSENPSLMKNLSLAFSLITSSKIETLNLAHNNLNSIPKDILAKLAPNLKTLDFRGNTLSTLNADSFPPNMRALLNLNFESCKLTSIHPLVFSSMPNLESLSLKGNLLTSVPSAIVHLSHLGILDMSFNRIDSPSPPSFSIPSGVFNNLRELRFMVLSYTPLRKLERGSFEGLVNIRMLLADNCEISFIEDFTFNSTKALEVLSLKENRGLRGINANTFYGLGNLGTLYLNSTGLTLPPVENLPSPMRSSSQLVEFEKKSHIVNSDSKNGPNNRVGNYEGILSAQNFVTVGNLLSREAKNMTIDYSLDADENSKYPFKYLTKLESLYLSQNNIRKIDKELFKNLEFLFTLDLSKNSLQPWTEPVFRTNSKVEQLYMGGNNLGEITEAMIEDFFPVENNTLIRKHIDLSSNPFHCNSGTCALKNLAENLTFELIGYSNPSHYTCYMLPTGQLTPIPISDLDEYFCKYGDYKTTTSSPETSSSTNLTPKIIENNSQGAKVVRTILISTSSLFLVALLSIFVYKKRAHFHYLWFGVKVNVLRQMMRMRRGKLSPNSYDFDVFVSYSHFDSNWIQDELLPQLEPNNTLTKSLKFDKDQSEPLKFEKDQSESYKIQENVNFRVCLHEREFAVGAPITENIVECVDRSKKIIIVVSKTYLESQWCVFEMNLAYHRLVEAKRRSFVLVLLEDIPIGERTKVLNYLMKSQTYLEWPRGKGQDFESEKKVFWKRLKNSIISDD